MHRIEGWVYTRAHVHSETGRTCAYVRGLPSLVSGEKMFVTRWVSISQACPSAEVSDLSMVHTLAATAGVNPRQLVYKQKK